MEVVILDLMLMIIISDMAVITNMLKLNLIKEENVTVATQSVTVEMYKTDLQQKYNQISAQIEHLNPSDYSQEAWSSMQNVLNASRQILNENDNTPINDRKPSND